MTRQRKMVAVAEPGQAGPDHEVEGLRAISSVIRACVVGLIAAAIGCGNTNLAPPSPGPTPLPTPLPTPEVATVADGEGNVYRTVRIGGDWWMAENLKATRSATGAPLPGVYAYADAEANVGTHGRLYTWRAATVPLITGWHLPTEAEWRALLSAVEPAPPGPALRTGGASGFNASMSGYRFYDGSYEALGTAGHFWTATPHFEDHSWKITIYANDSSVPVSGFGWAGALSVRLKQDTSSTARIQASADGPPSIWPSRPPGPWPSGSAPDEPPAKGDARHR